MIPIKVRQESERRYQYDERINESRLREGLEFQEEERELAQIHLTEYNNRFTPFYNQKVKLLMFIEVALVLRKVERVRQPIKKGKLATIWEGPFQVKKSLGNGAYLLETIQGILILKLRTHHI